MNLLNVPTPATTIIDETFLWGKVTVAVHEQQKKFYEISQRFYDEMMKIATGMQESFFTAREQVSPLVLDLDGDGVETIGTDSKVYFDHDKNGFSENTGWVGKDDGLLVRDINGDEVQGIKINSYYSRDSYKVETLQFSDGSTMNLGEASLLIQALSTFGATNSGAPDTFSNPTQDVSEMYSLAAGSDLSKKAA